MSTDTADKIEGEPGRAHPRARRAALVALLVIATFAAFAVAATLVSQAAYRRTFDTDRPLELRVTDSQTARCLAPWSAAHRSREFVMVMWLGGGRLLDAGDYLGATNVLRDAYRRAYRQGTKDQDLLALFQRAQEIEAIATNRKAHLMHGHEGPGSSLRPEDVER